MNSYILFLYKSLISFINWSPFLRILFEFLIPHINVSELLDLLIIFKFNSRLLHHWLVHNSVKGVFINYSLIIYTYLWKICKISYSFLCFNQIIITYFIIFCRFDKFWTLLIQGTNFKFWMSSSCLCSCFLKTLPLFITYFYNTLRSSIDQFSKTRINRLL